MKEKLNTAGKGDDDEDGDGESNGGLGCGGTAGSEGGNSGRVCKIYGVVSVILLTECLVLNETQF